MRCAQGCVSEERDNLVPRARVPLWVRDWEREGIERAKPFLLSLFVPNISTLIRLSSLGQGERRLWIRTIDVVRPHKLSLNCNPSPALSLTPGRLRNRVLGLQFELDLACVQTSTIFCFTCRKCNKHLHAA